MSWKRLSRRTVYVSCSYDMADEASVVERVLAELNRNRPQGDDWDFYRWTGSDTTWSASGTWQEFIPRPSDPNVALVVCLIGERLGCELPATFPIPVELSTSLPKWVRWSPSADDGPGIVPLTGTLFELLDAVQSGKDILCYVKTDPGRVI
jgi:hypothetical protein